MFFGTIKTPVRFTCFFLIKYLLMDYKFYESENYMSESLNDLVAEDWCHDSDTEDEVAKNVFFFFQRGNFFKTAPAPPSAVPRINQNSFR